MKSLSAFLILCVIAMACKNEVNTEEDKLESTQINNQVVPPQLEKIEEEVSFEVVNENFDSDTDEKGRFQAQNDVNVKNTTITKEKVADDYKKVNTEIATKSNIIAPQKPINKPVKPQVDNNKGVMVFKSKVFDFGFIEMGDQVDHEFSFINKGNEAINISSAEATCGCTTPSYTFLPIEPGGTGIISVHFDSKGRLGSQTAFITIVSDAREPIEKLQLKGVVRSEMAADKKALEKRDSL